MRKIILMLLAVLSLSACKTVEAVREVSVIDYSQFTKKGLFVTESESVAFDYEPKGSISVHILGGHEKIRIKENEPKVKGDIYVPFGNYRQHPVKPTLEAAFGMLIEEMAKLGADGLINLEWQYGTFPLGEITVKGMAIKRK